MDFNKAYAYLRTACREEVLSGGGGGCPVEIHTLEQAVGRHFTHLWVMGMRDSDWPPQVPVDPLLDLDLDLDRDRERKGNEQVARLFDHDDRYRRALARLQLTINQCRNRDAIVFSYSGRDASSDRLFMPSRGLGALRTGETGGGRRGARHEPLLWTDSDSFRRFEGPRRLRIPSRLFPGRGTKGRWIPVDSERIRGGSADAGSRGQVGGDGSTASIRCDHKAVRVSVSSVRHPQTFGRTAGADVR